MKKFFTFAMATLVCMSCAAKKPVAQQPAPQPVQQESETQRKIRELKEQQELEALQAEIELQRMQNEAKKQRLATQIGMEEQMRDGDQRIARFCYEESLDKHGEYMAGLGVSTPQRYEGRAKIEANNMAVHDIASRFMGSIKNGTEYYSQYGSTPGGKDLNEQNLESMTMNIVETTVNNYAEQACYQPIEDGDGMVRYYIALHVIPNQVVDKVADELDKQQLLNDKNNFKKQLLSQLDADNQKKIAAQERQLQMLKELEE